MSQARYTESAPTDHFSKNKEASVSISATTAVLPAELPEEQVVPMGPRENAGQPDDVPVVVAYADDVDEEDDEDDDVDDLDDEDLDDEDLDDEDLDDEEDEEEDEEEDDAEVEDEDEE